MNEPVKAGFSRNFMEGFVKRCYDMEMGPTDTEALFVKYANNQLLATPHIYEGFRRHLNTADTGMSKAALAKYLQPDILSVMVDAHIKFASTPWAETMRATLKLPDPSWDEVPASIRKVASQLSSLMQSFNSMPMQQQVLLSALAGAGAGALKRTVAPNDDDRMQQRGMLGRAGRGALRGGAIGAGAGLGAGIGGRAGMVDGRFNHNQRGQMLGSGLGALAGGLGAAALTQ